MSLGMERAGFRPIASVERDPSAALTYAMNFHAGPEGVPGRRYARPWNIERVNPEEFLASMGITDRPDVIVGGPPCQAYARVGRAKLRQVQADPMAFRSDPRGTLFKVMLDWVAALRPMAVIIENVPDMLDYGGKNVANQICRTLTELNYVARYGLLNAVHYGVPQLRPRLFILAVTEELGLTPVLPTPTNTFDLPHGYRLARRMVLRRTLSDPYWIEPPEPPGDVPPAVTAHMAIGDLPILKGHLWEGAPRRGRREDLPLAYRRGVQPSDYARLMRGWYAVDRVCGHVTRSLPRDYPIFERMPEGAEYPVAWRIANEILSEVLHTQPEPLRRTIVPPYDPTKFPNKWWKLKRDEPVRTLTAHMGRDTYSHIHYDSRQARTITVREAARLQSFPDGFRFAGGMNAAFRQIGNAVPPLLAYAVGRSLRAQMEGEAVDSGLPVALRP